MEINLPEPPSETYQSNLDCDGTPSDNPVTSCDPAESNLSPPASSRQPFLSVRSCVTCRRRKVKCDKAIPCANCARHGSKCVFPPPGRARPKPRARAAERILQRGPGGRPVSDQTAAFVSKECPTLSQSDIQFRLDEGVVAKEQWIDRWWSIGERLPKRLYMFDAKPGDDAEEEANCEYTLRLVELRELLHKADEVIASDREITIDSDARNLDPAKRFLDDFMTPPSTHTLAFCSTSPDWNLGSQHPSPSQIPFYWQTFVENVNPLVKLFHIPTLSKTIRSIQGRVRSLSPPEEALIFAIYFAAVGSMALKEVCLPPAILLSTSTDIEQVRDLLGQEKETLINQYRCATEQALARAEFMTSTDLMTLQAFVLYIYSARQYVQLRLTLNLTALAVRIAQGIGVHLGPNSQESPFDLETRRRLWLCLWILDLKTALDLGTNWLIADDCINGGLPQNINDSDLDPASMGHPTSRTGMTDMTHMLVKYEIGLLLKELIRGQGQKGAELSNEEGMEELVAKRKVQIQERYLQHCSDNGLEWLTATNAKLFLAATSLLIYHPVLSSKLRFSVSNDVRDHLVAACVETIECLHVLETMSPPHRRGWIFGTYLHWHATAFILESLYLRRYKADVARRSWNALGLVSSLCTTSLGDLRTRGPWSALAKLVERGKRIHEASLVLDAQGSNNKSRVVPSATPIEVDVELPYQVETGSNLSNIRGSISSMRHELHSIPDGFLETPNPAMSFETSSIRPSFPDFNEQFTTGGSHSISEFTDNLPISEGAFSTNPVFSGLWLTENQPGQVEARDSFERTYLAGFKKNPTTLLIISKPAPYAVLFKCLLAILSTNSQIG
ncbi:uncharacterized protein NECHADRAFT_88015 [Fusarium vanettenii 77-13-4]|uniref:Zn(2)-C6 fungal-type domain-containing protein n=1 Tax=Fusarium vanettenii (strain ATCC MYA-4622 / CBS 123669 / FGSC 9596 / NRRL 45880 / 77-13-4) TaxID=660122 RepID=C7ZN87_FUSV7|nr:uncharacterized protein NECHADRAFT_88015 [Fusarium vanettenii 77-13-4]EEU34515.1 hypothetical protein NECHADRAFT_88015 [Fusarium vanettenii 77-13-4]